MAHKADFLQGMAGVPRHALKVKEFSNLLLFTVAAIIFVAIVDCVNKGTIGIVKCKNASAGIPTAVVAPEYPSSSR